MSYVDGFVVPVPKRKLGAYRAMARKAGKVWRDHGALEYKECIADDVKWGKRTSFPRSVKQESGETVFFSYIVYKSRGHRDRVLKRVMKDKRLASMMDPKADLGKWAARLAATAWREVFVYFMHEPTAPGYASTLMRLGE